jgi:hypothetical protein
MFRNMTRLAHSLIQALDLAVVVAVDRSAIAPLEMRQRLTHPAEPLFRV